MFKYAPLGLPSVEDICQGATEPYELRRGRPKAGGTDVGRLHTIKAMPPEILVDLSRLNGPKAAGKMMGRRRQYRCMPGSMPSFAA
ncbi:hypothetical protein RM96_27510 [Cupriavidus sp. IDO]|nr:hypothetical protein RM96_27510 [Cupriavidus sp. IDO]